MVLYNIFLWFGIMKKFFSVPTLLTHLSLTRRSWDKVAYIFKFIYFSMEFSH